MSLREKLQVLTSLILLGIIANYANAQIVINEVFATNSSAYIDPSTYNYSNYIELYNPTSKSISVGGYYFANAKGEISWTGIPYVNIAAKQYLLVFADKLCSDYHLCIGIKTQNECIKLFNNNGELVDSITLPEQYIDIPYGRYPDGTETWQYLSAPTPKQNNALATIITSPCPMPEFSANGGFYSSSLKLSIWAYGNNTEVRYTLDGADPTTSSILYTKPLTLTTTTIVRAKVFQKGRIPGPTVTNTYFVNTRQPKMPVFSITSTPANFFDNTLGMYIVGTNGISGNCTSVANFNQDWERPIGFEYFNKSGKQIFSMQAGAKVAGACSRSSTEQKSLAIFARDKYGQDKIYSRFFHDKPFYKTESILLRNSGNDQGCLHFRDGYLQTLTIGQMNIDYQAFQPAVVYLNGEYWGILNIREKTDEDYLQNNYDLSSDSIDLLGPNENWNITRGDNQNYLQLKSTLASANIIKPEFYDTIASFMDVDEFIDYNIFQIYVANTDWPGNNTKFWRKRSPEGRWRWILYDTDFGFGIWWKSPSENTLDSALSVFGPDWPNPAWSTYLLRRCIENPVFKDKFIKKFVAHIGTTFNPARVTRIADSIYNIMLPEMPYQIERFGSESYLSVSEWNNQFAYMKSYGEQRPAYMLDQLANRFKLGSLHSLTLHSSPNGAVFLNGVQPPDSLYTVSYFDSIDFTLAAVPRNGYRFVKWLVANQNYEEEKTFFSAGSSWKYYDGATLPAIDWFQDSYDDSGWTNGLAELGYGDNDETTTISYGSDANNKYPTAYFRKKFTVTGISSIHDCSLSLNIDDGAIIYINGTEALRINMPTGTVDFNTLASGSPATENTFVSYSISSSLLLEGENTIAVEVHQNSVTSSDLSFDARLIGYSSVISTGSYESSESQITDTLKSNKVCYAIFEAISPQSGIYINEIAACNKTYPDEKGELEKWIELYNSTNDTVNLDGMLISPNYPRVDPFAIHCSSSETLTIAPNNFTLLFTDEETDEGARHLNFELTDEGGIITLLQVVGPDTLIVDSMNYYTCRDEYTFGRYPDGSQNKQFFYVNTPNAANNNKTKALGITDNNEALSANIYPNPVSNTLYLTINAGYTSNICVEIFDLTGRKVMSNTYRNNENIISLDVSQLQAQLYLLKINNSKNSFYKKFIKLNSQ